VPRTTGRQQAPASCREIPVTGGGLMWVSTNARAPACGKEVTLGT
jgi:hypothetical protein